jgi:hypothetical protein
MSDTNPHTDPVGHLAHTPPGTRAHDNHGSSGPPTKEVIERGYEADVYDTKTVLSVPFLVILFFVLAFLTVSAIFAIIAYPPGDPNARPLAVQQHQRRLNDRLMDNNRGPNHGTGQPRLEPLVIRDDKIDPRAITRPALPVADGNSPELHPEDLIVSGKEGEKKYPALYGPLAKGIGLDKTMGLDDKTLARLFPVQKNGVGPTGSQHVPTGANAGRGAAGSTVVVPGPQPKAPAPNPPKGDH